MLRFLLSFYRLRNIGTTFAFKVTWKYVRLELFGRVVCLEVQRIRPACREDICAPWSQSRD